MKNYRTKNVAKNIVFALLGQIIKILLSFISRTIFIRILGIEYLGLNGLFTNVLMLLSFAELGIGNAIIFSMYKPLATDDKEKIKSLMNLYAKAYRLIGAFVFIAGLLVIPFMGYIIKDTPPIKESINCIYLLFLVNTTLSYFFVYKKSIIIADQKNYIVSLYIQIFYVAQVVIQIVFLFLTREYVLFLIIQIISTILNNIVTAIKANKMYPYLKIGTIETLDKTERKTIFANVRALFLYKLGSVMLNGTDNIIISALIGITAVGLSSNYLLVVTAISTILGQIMNAFTASIGNLNAIGSRTNKEKVFKKLFLLSTWLCGFFAIGLFLFLNSFIKIWLGNDFLLSEGVVFAIVLHFYINSVHFTAYTYRVTMGLFVEGKLAPLSAAILNIILSLLLGKTFGLIGIFLATSIARFFTTGLVDPILVYSKGFSKNPIWYFIKYFLYAFLFCALYFLLKFIVLNINVTGILGFVIQVALVTIIFNGVMILIFWRNKDFKDIRTALSGVVSNIIIKR